LLAEDETTHPERLISLTIMYEDVLRFIQTGEMLAHARVPVINITAQTRHRLIVIGSENPHCGDRKMVEEIIK
jgi:hypothetical protein